MQKKAARIAQKKQKVFFVPFAPFRGYPLSKFCPRSTCLMAFTAKHGPPDLRLKRHLIKFSAMIANDIEASRSILTRSGLFRATFGTPLRRHHITLIKDFLFFFGKKESLFTLKTRRFYIRHHSISFWFAWKGGSPDSST